MFRVSGVLGWTVQGAGLESWVCKSPFGLGYCVGARGAGGVPVPVVPSAYPHTCTDICMLMFHPCHASLRI